MIPTRTLGNSDLKITPLGFGSWALGGEKGRYHWGPQDDRDSIPAIRRALELGVNWIDTAPIYGFGRSEEVVGRALEGVTPRPYLFTKCSLVAREDGSVLNSLKADSIKRECEQSLKRLKTEALDLYQIHWPNPEDQLEEGWKALVELKKEGKVRWIGVSNYSVGQMELCRSIAPVTSLQPPYSAVRRFAEKEILPYCGRENIGVIAYSPIQAGLLSGKMTRERIASLSEGDWRRQAAEFREPNLTRNLALQDLFGRIGSRHGHSAAVAALAWVLRRPEVTGAIVGARNAAQVDGFIAAMGFRLTEAEVREVEEFLEAQEE